RFSRDWSSDVCSSDLGENNSMSWFNQPEKRRPGFMLALFACELAIVVLGMGAFTRLAHAGLGCPDWPGCYGHALWPDEHHEIARSEERRGGQGGRVGW